MTLQKMNYVRTKKRGNTQSVLSPYLLSRFIFGIDSVEINVIIINRLGGLMSSLNQLVNGLLRQSLCRHTGHTTQGIGASIGPGSRHASSVISRNKRSIISLKCQYSTQRILTGYLFLVLSSLLDADRLQEER